jgi:hypothetical protein
MATEESATNTDDPQAAVANQADNDASKLDLLNDIRDLSAGTPSLQQNSALAEQVQEVPTQNADTVSKIPQSSSSPRVEALEMQTQDTRTKEESLEAQESSPQQVETARTLEESPLEVDPPAQEFEALAQQTVLPQETGISSPNDTASDPQAAAVTPLQELPAQQAASKAADPELGYVQAEADGEQMRPEMQADSNENQAPAEWEDLLGNGKVRKHILQAGTGEKPSMHAVCLGALVPANISFRTVLASQVSKNVSYLLYNVLHSQSCAQFITLEGTGKTGLSLWTPGTRKKEIPFPLLLAGVCAEPSPVWCLQHACPTSAPHGTSEKTRNVCVISLQSPGTPETFV